MPYNDILKIFDSSGAFVGVFVPAKQWEALEKTLAPAARPVGTDHDLEGFNELLASWNFAYSYDPAVTCPVCGCHTENWQVDSGQPFRLVSASIGGLLVFHCRQCGTTIRHKYYRRHMVKEHSA